MSSEIQQIGGIPVKKVVGQYLINMTTQIGVEFITNIGISTYIVKLKNVNKDNSFPYTVELLSELLPDGKWSESCRRTMEFNHKIFTKNVVYKIMSSKEHNEINSDETKTG